MSAEQCTSRIFNRLSKLYNTWYKMYRTIVINVRYGLRCDRVFILSDKKQPMSDTRIV